MSSLVSSPLDIYHTLGGTSIGFDKSGGYFIIHQGDDREIKTYYGFGVKAFKEARQDMEKLLEQKIMLTLWVKVKGGWSDDERALKSLGYGDI